MAKKFSLSQVLDELDIANDSDSGSEYEDDNDIDTDYDVNLDKSDDSGEVSEMEENLPKTCKVVFEDHNKLHAFSLIVTPDESFWLGGRFQFEIFVPEEYNIMPPQVRCINRIWHPNISEAGEVCLSLLRQSSYDSLGWAPTRKLKDVVWGINSLFSDLTNFDDPLNIDAADHYSKNKESFKFKVREYIQLYAKR